MISGVDPGDSNLTPNYFIRRHGKEMVTLVNTKTGAQRTLALETFMNRFTARKIPVDPEKLKVDSSCPFHTNLSRLTRKGLASDEILR